MTRTKYLVDKVSGKFGIDGRYKNKEAYEEFKPEEVLLKLIDKKIS